MKKINIKGQQAVEFAILGGILFMSSLAILYLLGDKLTNFFQNNSVATQKSISSKQTFNPYSQPKLDHTETISGYQVEFYNDGSITMNIEGQKLNYPKEFVDLNNTFSGSTYSSNFEQATGASGMEFIINEIAAMIKEHKAEYPNSDVPLQTMYGTGNRMSNDGMSDFIGNTEANIVQLKVKNDTVLIQNDQTCNKNSGACTFAGIYKVKGTSDKNNFLGTVYPTMFDKSVILEQLPINGTFNNAYQTDFSALYDMTENHGITFNWTMNFNKTF